MVGTVNKNIRDGDGNTFVGYFYDDGGGGVYPLNRTPDGNDVAEGATTAAAYSDTTGAATGTVVGILKGLYVAIKAILRVGGDVASGTADSGNPIKVGGIGSSTPLGSVADGSRANLWLSSRGSVTVAGNGGTWVDGQTNAVNSLFDLSGNSRALATASVVLNGAGTLDRQRGDVNGTWMHGNVASAVTDAGNPVKTGGVGNSSIPTAVTNGQRVNAWYSLNGAASVQVVGPTGLVQQCSNFGAQDNNATSFNVALVASENLLYNGTGWDRQKKPNLTSRLLSAAATTNATSVKASAGEIFKVIGTNAAVTKRYLKFYNKASAPTVGTDTPVLTLELQASSAFVIDLGTMGQYFSTGIAYAITGAAADADTTALSAGDILCLNITYAG